MEEFLADNGLDIEIVSALSDRCDKLIITQSRRMHIVDSFCRIHCDDMRVDDDDLAVFKDGNLEMVTISSRMLYNDNFDDEMWSEWHKDTSFRNRKRILLKFLIRENFYPA